MKLKKKLNQKKYFRIKKRIDRIEKDKFWALGEKAIKFEPFQAECTHMEIYLVILLVRWIMIIMEFLV